MKTNRIISLIVSAALVLAIFPNIAFASGENYMCDFTSLVKDNVKTMYGTEEDVIKLDDYTAAYLTHEGTYVDTDGKVYLTGGNNGKGAYTKGSYIEFTAPSNGTVIFRASAYNYYIDGTYTGYSKGENEVKAELGKGQKLQIGQRVAGTYISSLTFEGEQIDVTGYEKKIFNNIISRVNAPAETANLPLIVYLSGSDGRGEDNLKQMENAKPFLDAFKDKAVLAVPQSLAEWDIDALNGYISEAKAEYNASIVIAAGQADDAKTAYLSNADKIITIDGTAELTAEEITEVKNTPVWAFGTYGENINTVRTSVNSLQTAGADILYTEFLTGTNTAEAAAQEDILSWIDSTETPSKTVDLCLFAGQSNMAGRGEYAEATKCAPNHGFEYHSVTEPGVLTTVSEPFGKYENNSTVNDAGSNGIDRRSGDMVSAFMESYYSVSGVPIVGVQCSRGGTETRWWNSAVLSEAAARYNEAKEYLEANGYTIGKKFMVWCQGEADADNNRSIDTYKSNTKNIFNTLKTSTGLTDMFMVRIGHCKTSGAAAIDTAKDPRYKAVNLAQKELADEEENITAAASLYTDEYAALMRDQYHYHQEAYNSVGAIAGNNTAFTLYNKGEWTKYPEPSDEPDPTPIPVEGVFEITSSASEINVSSMKNYDSNTYRMYKTDGSYEIVTANNGKVANTTGGAVTVVPEYRFEFTDQTNPTDNNIKDYVKVSANSYSDDKGYGLLSGIDYKINKDGCFAKDNPIKVDLANGFYDITIYRKSGARADIYNNGELIANNSTAASAQNRPTSSAVMEIPAVKISGGINLTFGNLSGNNERIASVKIARVPEKYRKSVVWVAGDSESANYYGIDADGNDLDNEKIMITGFGQQLGKVLSDKYSVSNYGQPSATVKTWYDECFESVNSLMQKGDTILVDFGINEAVSSKNSITIDEMKRYMKTIIDAAKAKGVTPILVSPVYNGKYQHRTYFTYDSANNTNAIYAFAQECGVDCIDLNKWTQLYVSKAITDTGDADWRKHNYHVGDNLHLTQHSALLAASFIAAGMSELGYETSNYAYTYNDISEIGAENTRGAESGVSRVYGADSAKAFMKDGTVIQPSEKITIKYNDKTGAVTVDGGDGTIKSGTLIKAVYDGGVMKSIETQNIDFSKGAQITPEKGMKLYLWDSVNTMKPLSEAYVYTGAGQTPAPALSPTPTAVPDEPKEIIYSEDFEKYNTGDKAGWTSPAGTVSVKSDSAEGIGKYQTVVSGKSGTCRSGYVELPAAVTENFVFECDYKSSSNANVSDLELAENKNSIYANHGIYSNQNYVFTMARPRNEDRYVINNKSDDSGFTLDRYADPVFATKEISGNPWLHIKAVGDMENQKVIVYITSLDGKTEYHHGMYDMNVGRENKISSWKCIHLISPTTGADTCIDNIEIYKARKSDLASVYHKVKITCKAYSFEQYVLDGESVVNIPDISSYGPHFEGWTVGSDGAKYTSEQLKSVPITTDCEIVGNVGDGYIEAVSSVEFKDFPAGGELVMGEDENTFSSNPISLSITGEQGTSLVTNPDSRVNDYNVEWTFDGFRTLDGEPTGETVEKYCDSYGILKITDTAHNTAVDFTLKKTSANYYGRVTAKVTYNGKTIEVSRPLVLLGDKSNNGFLPKAGYTADYNKYEDTMVGYRAEQNDIVLGGWQTSGSDVSYADLKSDSAEKYLSLSRALSGNSSYIYNTIGDISAQTIFEQDIRFGIDGSISYADANITSPKSTAFSLGKSGNNITFNGKTLCTGESNKWYHTVICADPTSKKCYAKIYAQRADGDYSNAAALAESDVVDFAGAYTSGAVYRVTLSKSKASSVDLNNIKVYAAEIDENTIAVTVPETVNIPANGTKTASITVTAKTVSGDDAIGKAEWIIDDEFAEGVSIISTDNQSAQLSISQNASSGELPVKVTIGGKSKTVNIKLIGTKNNIAFTSAPTGVRLGSNAQYSAVLRNGQGDTITGGISYELYNADNTGKITPSGISINSSTGELTVSDSAVAQVIGVRASSGDISKFVRVNVYGLKFVFGTDRVKDGCTPVSASTTYSENRGYGIEGAAVSGSGTMSNLTFKVKLEKGKVYNVKAKYKGKIVCEKINSFLTGFERSKSALETDTYDAAIFGDNIMDITVPSGSEIASIEITPVTKTKADKPDWWTIGDSTVQQNGSWGYTIASSETTDLSKYPELAEAVHGFHNSGKAGEQHRNFYSNGRLNSILTKMNIGDVVSISGMGTNDSSSTIDEFKSYDEAYMNAIIDMGGYVILGSYTPSGNYGATEGKVYDADTMTFKGMRQNAYDRAIRELYEENKDKAKVLGFIDIGKMADEKMTADVKAVYDAAISGGKTEFEAREAANAKAAEMMAWWKDYNHYYTAFSNYILPDITKDVARLIKQ